MSEIYAVIEAGGTKFNCAIMDEQRQILAQTRIPTTTPDETLSQSIAFFLAQREQGFHFQRLGLACFGPLDLNPQSAQFGDITATPKPHWSNTPIKTELEQALSVPVTIDTDVNGAALAEHRWGAAQGAEVCIYVTVGTGIGGGVVINGKPLHGLIHPEIGHMLLGQVAYVTGVCPFHGNCLEGLGSGTAMNKIWQAKAETLPDEHPAWQLEAQVLGKMCHNLLVSFSPQKIVLGGGVMGRTSLLPRVINETKQSLQGYLTFPQGVDLAQIIVAPGLGPLAGLYGALALVAE